ncbi:MAG: outer membrane beta-barrel protein [Myxococcota bacterium]
MRKLFGPLVVLGALLAPARALAADPATANMLQLGLGFRYGVEMNEGDFNSWGVGLGVDGGYTLPMAVYVGGTFEYFFGDKVEAAGVEAKGNAWHLMAEGGYDLGLGENVVIRPKLGAGIGTLRGETCAGALGCTSDSSTSLALAPGVKAMLLTSRFSLSFDTRYALLLDDETAKALIFTFGVGF